MSLGERKPIALLLDDDPDFLLLANVVLKHLGVTSEMTNKPEEFLQRLKVKRPDFCLIDLNIGELTMGFDIVRQVREELLLDLPLFVVSSVTDAQAIAHALEMGANDYIVKPLDRELLASKLAPYIKAGDIWSHKLAYRKAPGEGAAAKLVLDGEIEAMDEIGVKFNTIHLMAKGMVIWLSSPTLSAITNINEPLLMHITSTWVNPAGKPYGAYAEFDETNEALLSNVRKWLSEHHS